MHRSPVFLEHPTCPTSPLKTSQEVITLAVLCAFSVVYLKEELKWNDLAGFTMIVSAVFGIFKDW